MTDIILHGCNGKMGRMVGDLISQDPEAVIVAGIDAFDEGKNPYPVFKSLSECDVKADVVIDFSVASAVDDLLTYCGQKRIPCVLCTTGLSGEQLEKVKETAGRTAILKSANMSLGIISCSSFLRRRRVFSHLPALTSRSWKSITIRSWMRQAAPPLPWEIP